jgi:hypothetical protein
MTPKGNDAFVRGDTVVCRVPACVRAEDEQRERQKRERIDELEAGGINVAQIPVEELDAGGGPVMAAELQWIRTIKQCVTLRHITLRYVLFLRHGCACASARTPRPCTLHCSHGTLYCSHDTLYCSHDTLYCSHDTLYCLRNTLYCSRDTFAHDTRPH